MSPKLSWRERLAAYKNLPKVKPIPARMQRRHGTGTIAIPSPQEVEAAIRAVPARKLATIEQLGSSIARKHRATIGCTVTTAIFASMVARASHEDEIEGRRWPAPYWRAIRANGELNPRYPGGIVDLVRRLEAEGHAVVRRGNRWFVENYEARLVK
jgi:hypothetical protein